MATLRSSVNEDDGIEKVKLVDHFESKEQLDNLAIEQQLKSAFELLYKTFNVQDSNTHKVITTTSESQLYLEYKNNQALYMYKKAAFIAAYLEAQKTKTGKATWPLLATTLQIPVKSAYDKWRSNYADKIEQALAILNTNTMNH